MSEGIVSRAENEVGNAFVWALYLVPLIEIPEDFSEEQRAEAEDVLSSVFSQNRWYLNKWLAGTLVWPVVIDIFLPVPLFIYGGFFTAYGAGLAVAGVDMQPADQIASESKGGYSQRWVTESGLEKNELQRRARNTFKSTCGIAMIAGGILVQSVGYYLGIEDPLTAKTGAVVLGAILFYLKFVNSRPD